MSIEEVKKKYLPKAWRRERFEKDPAKVLAEEAIEKLRNGKIERCDE